MKKFKAVIFDMDGVIVHSNPVHKVILQEFCAKHGKELTDEMLREKVYGRTNQDWIPNVFGDISDETIQQYADEKEQMFRDVFNPKEHMVPGLYDFLDELDRAGLKKVVATSAPAENEDFILKELGISDRFDAVLNSSHVTKSKPNPEPYLKAAAAINVDPSECIVIEDSISGVESGLNAGATVIGITTTHTREEMKKCALIADDFNVISVADFQEL
jgi:HAD superfamily hydrolase (TIGR01509 family)